MKHFLIDIDGTICDDIKNEDSHLYPSAQPIHGAIDQINKWYDEGHTITFFTAREEKDRDVTIDWLIANNVKFNGLIMNKPRCANPDDEYVWIDNRLVRGVTYKGLWGDLKEVTKKILTFGQ
jgi:uncharacterized HAD superfamily protein